MDLRSQELGVVPYLVGHRLVGCILFFFGRFIYDRFA